AVSLVHNLHSATGTGRTATTTLEMNTRVALAGHPWTLAGKYSLTNASSPATRTTAESAGGPARPEPVEG
ncbi:MAG: hypothetical protein ABSB57_01365, partial [Dehalococcoidia bacterium]